MDKHRRFGAAPAKYTYKKKAGIAILCFVAALTCIISNSPSSGGSPSIPVAVKGTTKRGPHYAVPVGKAPVYGPKDALVTIIAYMDFQCPFCDRAFKMLLALSKKHSKEVRLVFKHFPLAFRKHAKSAAEAAVEAQEQKKFWETVPLIFGAGRNLNASTLESIAKKKKLKLKQFKSALSSKKHEKRVNSEIAEGRNFGVRGTPTIFINGMRHVGAKSSAAFEKAIKSEIAKAKKLLKKPNIKRSNLYAELIKTGIQKAQTTSNRKRVTIKAAGSGSAHGAAKVDVAQIHTYSPEIKELNSLTIQGAPSLGPKTAPLTLVWFGSFNCYDVQRIMQAWFYAAERHKNKIRLIFKHHIPSTDKTGFFSAQAAREAYSQGLFWEFVAINAGGRYARNRDTVIKNCADIGMDMKKLTKSLKDKTHEARIKLDLGEARHIATKFNRNKCGLLYLPDGQLYQGYISGYNLDRMLKSILANLESSHTLIPLP